MKKTLWVLAAMALLGTASTALAEPAAPAAPAPEKTVQAAGLSIPSGGLVALGIGIGAGLIVMGAARGISNIGASAVESIARQPEVKGDIFTAMLLSAALIEGFTFFALLIQFTITGLK